MDLWSYYGLLVLYCFGLHETDTQHPEYFQKPVLVSSVFSETACERKNAEAARLLVQYNADTNHRCNRGWTALHEAVSRNDLEIIDILVKGGAKIESANAYGITSLFVAAESGQLEALRYLARCGEYGLHASINLTLNNSEFPSNTP